MSRALVALALCVALAACGRQEPLRPKPGGTPPPKPATAPVAPTSDEMLKPGAEARPERDVEMVRRSRERAEDPFDLPPGR